MPDSATSDGIKVRRVTTIDAPAPPLVVARVRRVRRTLVWAITALLLVMGLVLADWWQAKREMGNLVDAVVVSRAAISTGFVVVNPSMADATGVNQSQSDLDTARGAIRIKCVTAAADVQNTGALVSEVYILPWHRSLGAAQDAYSAHNQTWQGKFAACADDPSRWADGSTTAQVLASGRVAHRALIKALPVADVSDRRRIETLFTD